MGGARDGGRGPGEARAVFTFVFVSECGTSRYLYNSSAQPRLTRAVQQTPLAPFHSYQLPPRTGGIRASPGCGESGLGESSHELRRPQKQNAVAERGEEGGPLTCVCGARVDSLRSRTDHTPQPTLSRLAVALGQ